MFISKAQTGYCPEQKHQTTIYIEMQQIKADSKTQPQYVKNGFCCEHYIFHGCSCCGKDHLSCPIFMASSN